MSNDKKPAVLSLEELQPGRYYRVRDLQAVLKGLNLLHSIYIIRDYETWKCMDYKCGKRHDVQVDVCSKCYGNVRAPLIPSPRTRGGGRGPGRRQYSAGDIKSIIEIFRSQN